MIREANKKDYPELCAMAKQDKFVRDFPAISYRWGWEGKVFLAEEKGEIAGFYYANICKRIDRATLYEIYVAPRHRNKGVGKKLFEHYLVRTINAGKNNLRWLVNKKNLGASQFYGKMGFQPSKEKQKEYLYEEKIH